MGWVDLDQACPNLSKVIWKWFRLDDGFNLAESFRKGSLTLYLQRRVLEKILVKLLTYFTPLFFIVDFEQVNVSWYTFIVYSVFAVTNQVLLVRLVTHSILHSSLADSRSSPSKGFLWKSVLKICSKFTTEYSCRSVISV